MSISVDYMYPTDEVMEFLAKHLREADVEEIAASSGLGALDSIKRNVELSDRCFVMLFNGVPVAVIGLVQGGDRPEIGVPWLLGTKGVDAYPMLFVKSCKYIVGTMLGICDFLANFVHAKNTTSVKFLSMIGFIIEEPLPHGIKGELFHRFYIGDSSCVKHPQ